MSICILLLDWWFIIDQKTKPKVKENIIFLTEETFIMVVAIIRNLFLDKLTN